MHSCLETLACPLCPSTATKTKYTTTEKNTGEVEEPAFIKSVQPRCDSNIAGDGNSAIGDTSKTTLACSYETHSAVKSPVVVQILFDDSEMHAEVFSWVEAELIVNVRCQGDGAKVVLRHFCRGTESNKRASVFKGRTVPKVTAAFSILRLEGMSGGGARNEVADRGSRGVTIYKAESDLANTVWRSS